MTRPTQTDPIHTARGSLRHPGWLRRNHRLASVGTGGWFQSESPAVFIGIRRQYQYVLYYPGGFLISDFYLPGQALRIEVDGKEHLENYVFDKTRDDWLLKNMRIRTLRLKNDMVKRNPLAAEAIIREHIGA